MSAELRQLGRYMLEGVLGKGAMGVVYLARDPVIGRRIALKTLIVPADAEEAEEFGQRFLREAQAVGILNHPGIVTVHDAGVDETSGLSYIAMEFIEGRTLKDFAKGGHGFAFSEVARIGAALAGALDYAHSKGVIHRDIKPANIILTPQGVAKITDFGVARMESSNLTATGQFIGTPNYMSPEQVMGGAVDGRSDLFSLGVVIFELLTGTRPFAGASLTEITYKIVHEPPPIPSQVRQGVPPAFNPIILKLLEKDASKRYARGADVARALDALRRVLSGMVGETTRYITPPSAAPRQTPESVSVGAAPTATRSTEVAAPSQAVTTPVEQPVPAKELTVWRLPIEIRWVAILLSVVLTPPLLLGYTLYRKIDRGPWDAPPPGELLRRGQIAKAQRRAIEALNGGQATRAMEALQIVFRNAPYSDMARILRQKAIAMATIQRDAQARQADVITLLNDGTVLLDQGRFRDAQSRFERVIEIAPDNAEAKRGLTWARSGQRQPTGSVRPTPIPVVVATPAAVYQGQATLAVYFNCPLGQVTIELDLDGQPLARKPFDFRKSGLLGIKMGGSGVVQETFSIPAGVHKLMVRVRDSGGASLGEQTLPLAAMGNARYRLKIEMENKQGPASFTITQLSRP